ncbi:MAG: aldehyde:ferredoxin oxidoreductase [Deltaproteobacteria bacterium]|nr:aldehyde:ferredoxin oxidoreductase [Deltaproteobacteria bacterium]
MKKPLNSISYSAAPINGGTTDRILRIDLSTNELSIQELPPDFKQTYIGGRGYALKLIWDETDENTCFDSPENPLIMAGGPLCNEPRFPGTGKFIVGTISPLTNTFMDSNVGGYFSSILKACGFDAIAVTGIADEKCVVIIDDDLGKISIVKAPTVDEAVENGGISYGENLLKEYTNNQLHKNIAAIATGIGAETTDFGLINSFFYDSQRKRLRTKQAGRGGTGTVMRYKGLMGVIVHASQARSRGNNPVDPAAVKAAGSAFGKVIKSEDPKQLNLAATGTPALVEYMNNFHLLPINNFQRGQDEKSEQVFANVFWEQFLKKKRADGCYFGCNLSCAKGAEEVTLQYGPKKGSIVGIDGPEYETVGAVTGFGIFDAQYTMEYNWYCDEYGIDTISTGVVMAFIMECWQRGYLTREEVGYDLNWGDIEAADRLFHETATAKGVGRIAANGVQQAKLWIANNHAKKSGTPVEDVLGELEKFAMEMKGLEFSMYISRESLAQQGGYGFALKGPQHDEAWLIFLDQVHREMETFEMKTAALKWFPLIRTWFSAVGLCKLPWIDVRHSEAEKTDNPAQNIPSFNLYIQFLNATTGSNKTIDDILQDSERLHLLQKMINLRQGKGTREFDLIPLRAMAPAFPAEYRTREAYYDEWLNKNMEQGSQIPETIAEKHRLLVQLRKEAYETLCDSVYKARGYSINGIPLPETLKRFDLFDEKALAIFKTYGFTTGLRN